MPGTGGQDLAAALWERGRQRYPELRVDVAAFREYLRARGDLGADAPAEDLFLACACLGGAAGAADRFAREYRPSLATFVARFIHDAHAIEELVDVILTEMLVAGDGSVPRLATYAGRGPLRAWLRMLAARRALNETRDGSRHARLEQRMFNEATSAVVDPEIALIKQRYGPDFQSAFRDALAAVAPSDRALLRLHHGEELPLADLAAIYGWSKPTASRRVAAARAAVLEGAYALLRQRLRLDAAELESLFRVVRSQLEVSLAGLMRTGTR